MPNPIQLANLHLAIPAAQLSAAKWHVPASVTLAQWIPESSWGLSKLAMQANNYFGVKFSHVRGDEEYVEMLTPEYEAGKRVMVMQDFKKYPDVAASFDDHGRLLATSARYAPAMRDCDDYVAFCGDLQHCGYSTTPTYAVSLLAFIREFNLTQYDKPVTPAGAGTL